MSPAQSIPILHFITELSIGGAQMALLRLLERLDRQRFDIQVACLYNGDGIVAEQIKKLSIPVTDLGMSSKLRLDALGRFYGLLRCFRPAILHTWMFHANIPGRILGRAAGVPVIISSERTMGQEGALRRLSNRWTAGLADRIVCVSQNVADFAGQSISLPASKLVVIPNGIDLQQYAGLPGQAQARAALRLPLEKTLIGTIGRPRPVKGYTYLVEAFARLSETHPDTHLLFVGDGPDQSALMQQAQSAGLAERITFLGDQLDIPHLLPALDIFVLPSLYEGLPNVVLEAMACGLPVVATAVGGTPELVIDRESGLLIPPKEPIILAEALSQLILDPEQRARLGKAAKARVEQHFSIENTVLRTEQLYTQALAERGVKTNIARQS